MIKPQKHGHKKEYSIENEPLKVYIECGCYDGSTLRKTIDSGKYDGFWFLGLEPVKEYADMASELNPEADVIQVGAWVEDKNKMLFYLGDTEGSTLFKSKTTDNVGKNKKTKVKMVDFSSWLGTVFDGGDYVSIRMNMEGAEYPVLEKMIEDGTIAIVRELDVCWHYKKIPEISSKRHNELLVKLKKYGL